jgi:polysaccharide export outer membrane protein
MMTSIFNSASGPMPRFSSLRFCCGLALAMALGACATPKQTPVAGPTLTVTEQKELPAPAGSDLAEEQREAVIGAYDLLSINVFGVPELSVEKVQVDPSGRIAIPLAGSVVVAGKTPAQAAEVIKNALHENFVKNPRVTINVLESRSQYFSIQGEVQQPGNYPAVGQMSLMRAVSEARGTTEYALLDNVVVFRTVDGRRMAGLYNLGAIRRGIYDDPKVYANDVIIVGNSQARRIFKDALQIIPTLASPLVYLLSNN